MIEKYWPLLFSVLILPVLILSGCSSLPGGGPNPFPLPNDEPLWLTDGFDFPVGNPDGKGWAVTGYAFLDWSAASQTWHPGEDWNIPGAGNGDWGEPVYAAANGEVVYSGWNTALGNVILIKHSLSREEFVWSQYAHLDCRTVAGGELVHRRQVIGTVGRGPNNRFSAHLHFELRKVDLPANAWPRTNGQPWPKSRITDYWLAPSYFIQQNRPQ